MDEKEFFRWDEVSLYAVLRDLLINLWVIVLAGLAVWIGVGSVAQLRYVPEYTSYATLAVSAKGSGVNIYSNLMVTNQMAGVIGEVFSSHVLREKIAQDLGVGELSGTVEASVINETNLLTVQATAPSAKLAHQILSSAIANYEDVSNYLFSNASLRVLQQPSVPPGPSNSPQVGRTQKVGALVAMGLVGAASVAFTLFRPTVQTLQSARCNVEGNLLGYVPFEWKWKSWHDVLRRRKRSLLLNSAGVSMTFSEAFRKIVTRLEFRMKRSGHHVLLVTSVGENEGKSSVAVNIALAMAEKGRRVLLLDGDLKKPALHKVLELTDPPERGLKDYMEEGARPEDLVQYDEKSGLYVVRSDGKRIAATANTWDKLRILVEKYSGEMDYVIIDSAPMAVTSDTEYLLQDAQSVLFVVRQDWCATSVINEKLEMIRQRRIDVEGIVLNAVHPVTLHMGDGGQYYQEYGERHRQRHSVEAEHEK